MVAEAQPVPKRTPSFELGARFDIAVPYGNWANDEPQSNMSRFALLPRLDANYSFSREWGAGLYVVAGLGKEGDPLKDVCGTDGVACKQIYLQAGVQVERRFLTDSFVSPWAGANLGLEWLHDEVTQSGARATTTCLGIAVGGSLGVDFQAGNWGFGPLLSFQLASYLDPHVDLSGSAFASGAGIAGKQDRAVHYWLNFGVRAHYRFGT